MSVWNSSNLYLEEINKNGLFPFLSLLKLPSASGHTKFIRKIYDPWNIIILFLTSDPIFNWPWSIWNGKLFFIFKSDRGIYLFRFHSFKQHEKNICITPSIIQIRYQRNQRSRYFISCYLSWMVEQPTKWESRSRYLLCYFRVFDIKHHLQRKIEGRIYNLEILFEKNQETHTCSPILPLLYDISISNFFLCQQSSKDEAGRVPHNGFNSHGLKFRTHSEWLQ